MDALEAVNMTLEVLGDDRRIYCPTAMGMGAELEKLPNIIVADPGIAGLVHAILRLRTPKG